MISSTNYTLEEQISTYQEEVLDSALEIGTPNWRLDVKLPLKLINFLISEDMRANQFTNYFSATKFTFEKLC